MADETPKTIDELDELETVFSRDDWRPGEIARAAHMPAALEAGDVLFGAYEIESKLGEGGMGAVYRARHLSLGSARAIKMMNANLSGDPEAVERFHREARALLEVHHPAVVRCHDLLRDDFGRVFVVMEMIEGVPLSQRMAERPLSVDELRALAKRVGGGLAAAHAQGVVHRDVAPDNIMLPNGQAEQAKLVDFGIAKVLKAGEQTVNAGFKGKIAFASPEQLGFYDSEVGPASDFFSLGLVLCAAALGERLDMGKNFASAVDARRKPVVIPSGVPAALRQDIAKLLVLDPKRRPLSTEGLFEPDTRAGWGPWRKVALGMALAAGIALGVGVGTDLLGSRALPPSEPASSESEPSVAAPIAGGLQPESRVEPEASQDADDIALAATEVDSQALFEAVRSRLIDSESQAPEIDARFTIAPNPVATAETYVLEIESNCACQAFVFLIDSQHDRIDLLYPNPIESPRPLARGEVLRIPSSEDLYTFTATASSGVDRIKVLLLEKPVDFPRDLGAPALDPGSVEALIDMLGPDEAEFWSASPDQPERIEQLASLLDGLEPGTWASAETVLHVVQ